MADWITSAEAARLTGYHPDYLRKIIRAGKVKSQKWGRELMVSRTSLLAYVRKSQKSGAKRGPKPRS